MGVHHRELRDRRARTFAGQATCVLDREGHFLNVSPSLASFFRCDSEDLRGRSLLSCLGPGEAEQLAAVLADVRRGLAVAFEVRLLGPGGTPTWVAMELAPAGQDAGGGPLMVACFAAPGH